MKVYRSNVFEDAVHEANVLPLEPKILKFLGANPAIMLTCVLKIGVAQESKTVAFFKDDIEGWTKLKLPAQIAALIKLAEKGFCEFVYSSLENKFNATFLYSIDHIVKAVSQGISPDELNRRQEAERNEFDFPKTA